MCGGAARWKHLLELDVSERALRAAVRSGEVRAVGRGGYALLDAPPGLAAAVELGGVASHGTATALHGWPIWIPEAQLSVTLLSGVARSLPGVAVHQARLRPADIDGLRACTAPLRTALDCARTMSFVNAVCILDAALHRREVTEAQLADAARRARGPGAAALRRAIAAADRHAASPLETVLRLLLRTTDARVRSQVYIEGVGTVDFLVDEWLVVEGDGYEFHSDRTSYRNDRRRGNGIVGSDLVLLRFTYEDVRYHPELVIAKVEQVRRLRRPSAER